MARIDDVLEVILRNPGLSGLEISERLFGPGAPQSAVHPACLALLQAGKVKRYGSGQHGDPFRYEEFRTWDG